MVDGQIKAKGGSIKHGIGKRFNDRCCGRSHVRVGLQHELRKRLCGGEKQTTTGCGGGEPVALLAETARLRRGKDNRARGIEGCKPSHHTTRSRGHELPATA